MKRLNSEISKARSSATPFIITTCFAFGMSLMLSSCQTPATEKSNKVSTDQEIAQVPNQAEFSIPFKKYTLKNGLNVILHQDHSDPIVAIATIVHVGSSREKPGRTGFAHFFEHMAFNDSENVPQGANRKMIGELGGTRNGGTWSDGTIYYEVVPKDALEKLMWIDSDRLGFMINTVTEGALEREKQVVKNEKRQRVDNRAYGHTSHVIRKALYPSDHPYSWTVIGDLKDLQAATLEDVREFYDQFYGPGNATLAIAGDIDIEEIEAMIERWFGEIKPRPDVEQLQPRPVTIEKSKYLYHLDNFAKLPELRITFPTVEQFHPDSYALSALGEILANGKRASLYKALVTQGKLAPGVSAYQSSSEIAGTFTIQVRGNSATDLDDVKTAIDKALNSFESDGFSENELLPIKARQETEFYSGVSSVLNKAFQLANYDRFAGDPGYISQDIEKVKQVTQSDVMRVYRKYIHNKPAVYTSFVPKTQQNLALKDSLKADVSEEKIVQNAEKEFNPNKVATFKKTPTKFDRSEPPLGELPKIRVPDIYNTTLDNGIKLLNIEHRELPLVEFQFRIDGGAWLEDFNKLGTARLMAELMNEGTALKTPEELEDALGKLGANVTVTAEQDAFFVSGTSLARSFSDTMALVSEMLLKPRWESSEFKRLQARRITRIKQAEANPFSVANRAFMKRIYGEQHRAGLPTSGNTNTISDITLNDLKTFYSMSITPANTSLHVVGDISQSDIKSAIKPLVSNWQGIHVPMKTFTPPAKITSPTVYFIDIPNAKQSVIIVGKAALKGDHEDYNNIQIAQNRLGSGSSARLFQTLRIQKGYTYGARSRVIRQNYNGPFMASTQVRTNVTLESLEVIKDLIGRYDETFTEDDLATTKNLLTKQMTRQFETLDSLLRMLNNISDYHLPTNFIELEQNELLRLSVNDIRKTFTEYAEEKNMIYVVAGDAKSQLERVKTFGYPVIRLNKNGEPL